MVKNMGFEVIPTYGDLGKRRNCLACGTDLKRAARRYCSKECRVQMLWVLSLSKGLLRAFNARYAAFSFTQGYVMLDVLPVWSKEISRFVLPRTHGKKPAEDLKHLVLRSGQEWYQSINSRNSKSLASLLLLKKNCRGAIAPGSITPDRKIRPRLSKQERESVELLQLRIEELLADGHISRIRSSYRKLAKTYHPDAGGDEEKFKKLNQAHHQMLSWAESPHYTLKKALMDCWSYDGLTNRWTPPL